MEGKNKIDIQHPEAWELLVLVEDELVSYILYTPSVDGSLITGEVERADDSLQALEDAIYDTGELLNEYKRTRVIVHSNHFVLLPLDTPDDDCTLLLHEAFPDDDGDVALSPMAQNGVKIAYLMPRGLQAFLGRTFNYPTLFHHLSPLCEHFKQEQCQDNRSRMLLNLRNGHMDLAVYRDGSLQCANTYPLTNADDAVYYALNAWRTHGMDQLSDELQITGNHPLCAAMTTKLREFVKHVMPFAFPTAAMRLGRNAIQAPLELILLALCE